MVRKSVTTVCLCVALALPAANAFAAARLPVRAAGDPKKVVSNITVDGTVVKCHQWGYMEVQLKVIKTEVTAGTKKKVSIKITGVTWPVWPTHTPRSIYINQQALPLLAQETLQLQASAATNLQDISGASNTTVSWQASLQAALTKAETP
jgi:hypothetical protein